MLSPATSSSPSSSQVWTRASTTTTIATKASSKMNVMVLPELFAKRVHFTSIHSVYLLNKYKHLIKWKNNPSIMEFGFGDGGTSAAALQPLIPQDCKEFIAADVSQQMVKYAEQNAKLPKVGKIIQFNISAQNVSSEFQNRFDHIFSFFTFNCIPNISAR
ncbi:juvenile hormone acid O-methyltransferase-like [Diorhabda carinulata]|uniref:juvenile hormone acid O-methyltransferase-like n=1 Tax=Diorhabda carinulata TaxID=1163345 RepID=UPI0025A034B5|nr:juvenile hormone acid O-methyltransferase-like [Diorhabda carinulata]